MFRKTLSMRVNGAAKESGANGASEGLSTVRCEKIHQQGPIRKCKGDEARAKDCGTWDHRNMVSVSHGELLQTNSTLPTQRHSDTYMDLKIKEGTNISIINNKEDGNKLE